MKKEFVVKKNWEFQNIIDSKKQVVTNAFILYYYPNEYNHLRIGISISKKFANAPERNYFRRQIRSILDNIDNIWNIKMDVVLIARKSIIDESYAKKEKEVRKIFERLINEL